MQPASTLPELVEQLGRTHSPFERLKILIRAWALLRKMTAQERMTIAARLGLDHADDLVEAIARRSGAQASPVLISLIEKAQVKGTPHLPELIADLRDPGKRAERLRQGAQTLLEEAAPSRPLPPPGPPPARSQPPAPPPSPAVTAPASPHEQPAPPVPAAVSLPATPPTTLPVTPPIPAPPAPAPSSVQVAPAPPPKPEPPPPPVRPAEMNPLAGQLAAISSLTPRFHALRRQLKEARRLTVDDQRSVVEAFPDGWARRRALLELMRSGALASVRDALGLVESLGAERDRLWCLGAFTDSCDLSDSEKESLLAVASSPAARRRLGSRLGRHARAD